MEFKGSKTEANLHTAFAGEYQEKRAQQEENHEH